MQCLSYTPSWSRSLRSPNFFSWPSKILEELVNFWQVWHELLWCAKTEYSCRQVCNLVILVHKCPLGIVKVSWTGDLRATSLCGDNLQCHRHRRPPLCFSEKWLHRFLTANTGAPHSSTETSLLLLKCSSLAYMSQLAGIKLTFASQIVQGGTQRPKSGLHIHLRWSHHKWTAPGTSVHTWHNHMQSNLNSLAYMQKIAIIISVCIDQIMLFLTSLTMTDRSVFV